MPFYAQDYKETIKAPMSTPPVMDQQSRDSSLEYFQGKIGSWLFDQGMNVEEGAGFEMADGADNLRIYELSEDGKTWKNPFEDGTAYNLPYAAAGRA